jgi:regulator of sirC expression with transglutaminase-like and TPR domain
MISGTASSRSFQPVPPRDLAARGVVWHRLECLHVAVLREEVPDADVS